MRWPELKSALNSRGIDYEFHITERAGHATELSEAAAEKRCEAVVAVGGDGTLNEVGNGIMRVESGKRPKLGVVPGGRGSDFCRAMGMPYETSDIVEMLERGNSMKIDAGLMRYADGSQRKNRFFFNLAGMGFDADVTYKANRLPGFLGGTLPYLLSVFIELGRFKIRDVHIRVDGELVFEGPVVDIIVANGKYAGGGMQFSPNSVIDDGLFNVIVLKKATRTKFLLNFPKVYKGTHLSFKEILELKGSVIEVDADQEMLLQPDGEVFGEAPVRFEVHKDAIDLIIP